MHGLATTVATSIDGGHSFGGETYLNQSLDAYDEATGSTTVNLGPVLDNQSAGNPETGVNNVFSYGTHQSVAVWGGQIFAAWSSNLNGGFNPFNDPGNDDLLDIRVAQATIAAGPRITDGTSGPVGDPNNTVTLAADPDSFAADTLNQAVNPINGGPEAQAFEVTFDRPVDASTFTPGQVIIQEFDVNGAPCSRRLFSQARGRGDHHHPGRGQRQRGRPLHAVRADLQVPPDIDPRDRRLRGGFGDQ